MMRSREPMASANRSSVRVEGLKFVEGHPFIAHGRAGRFSKQEEGPGE